MEPLGGDFAAQLYREKGAGDLLLILPENTASSACHVDELDYFGQNYHTVSMGFLGTGKSSRVLSRPTDWWNKCAEDAASLISHLGKKRGVVIGTSGGANIALLFAAAYPERVPAVIADSCVEFHSPENLRKEVSARSLRTDEQIGFWSYANGEDWEDVMNADNKLLLDLADQGGNLFNGRLSTIKCPVLFTASLKDSSLPDIGEQNIGMAK